MNQQLICELNLALIPETELASRHITFSRQMAGRYRSLIQLDGVTPKVAFTPHVTLYQVPVQAGDLPELHAALLNVAAKAPQLWLSATEYRSNQDEGSFEVRYAPATSLMELQADTIAMVNPLRKDLLLERDPAGRRHHAGIGRWLDHQPVLDLRQGRFRRPDQLLRGQGRHRRSVQGRSQGGGPPRRADQRHPARSHPDSDDGGDAPKGLGPEDG